MSGAASASMANSTAMVLIGVDIGEDVMTMK